MRENAIRCTQMLVLSSQVQQISFHHFGRGGQRRGGKVDTSYDVTQCSSVSAMECLVCVCAFARIPFDCRERERERESLRLRESVCCFVLIEPMPEKYRLPRVSPGVTASKLFSPLLPSLATPGPPLPYRPLQNAWYYCPALDLRRGYEAPFLDRPGRLPLWQGSKREEAGLP